MLLADDDEAMRDLVATGLRRAGFEVTEAANGSALLAFVRALGPPGSGEAPDVVISDIRMPGASGLEVVQALRAAGWTIPVILITGFGDAETHADAIRLGATVLLDKPFELSHLVHLVGRLAPIR